jgi:Zn-dependent membrane protease YugP
MPYLIGLAVVAILAAVALPQLWVRRTLAKHGTERPDLPGTGGELARHLLDRHGLTDVKVDATQTGDHYNPETRTVHLSDPHLAGRSLSAVAVAAHEVGHAIQHANGERLLA